MAHLQWSGVNVSDGPGHPLHICNGLEQDCVMAVMVRDIYNMSKNDLGNFALKSTNGLGHL